MFRLAAAQYTLRSGVSALLAQTQTHVPSLFRLYTVAAVSSQEAAVASTITSQVASASPIPSFTMQQLIDARVHIGHHASVWNPKFKPFVAGVHNGVHIINLDETEKRLKSALELTSAVVKRNGVILFVNTRPQFDKLVRKAAIECGEYYVTRKWIPGAITNCLETLVANRQPDLMIMLSLPVNRVAINEAHRYDIKTIGIVDSDTNPAIVSHVIPGNDDTESAMQLYVDLFKTTILNTKVQLQPAVPSEEVAPASETPSTELFQ